MHLGIHLGTFQQPTLEEKLDAVVRHGLSCVHFNFKSVGLASMPERIDDALVDRIVREMAARRLTIATLSGTFNMIHPDVEARREGLRRLEVIAGAARPLGTQVVTLCTGTRDPSDMWRFHPDNRAPEARQDLLDSMAEAIEIAARADVTLGIEPETGNVVDSAPAARRLLDELASPRLKIIMDGLNLFGLGSFDRLHEVLDEAFVLLGTDIAVGHAKHLDARWAAVPMGWASRGVLDYDHYLALFHKNNFDGPLILHSLAESEVANSVAFLRAAMARAEER